jgi:hypothetical protein
MLCYVVCKYDLTGTLGMMVFGMMDFKQLLMGRDKLFDCGVIVVVMCYVTWEVLYSSRWQVLADQAQPADE